MAEPQTGFLLAEDEAMKAKLSGIQLSDRKQAARNVPVRFRYPAGETRTDDKGPAGVTYPLVTIELLSVAADHKRNHAGPTRMLYRPDQTTFADEEGKDLVTEFPLPVILQYQITTWTTSHQHHVALLSQLLDPDRLPLQHGWIYIPADDTYRYLEVMPVQQGNMVDQQRRRIFRSIYTVHVEAELLKTKIAELGEVTSVVFDPPEHQPDHLVGVI